MRCPNPGCNTDINYKCKTCPVCGMDLLPLVKLEELPDYYFNLAVEACKQEEWYTAVEALAIVRALNPGDTGAWILAGKVYIRLEQMQKAESCFNKALKIDTRNNEAQDALIWLHAEDRGTAA